MQRQVLDFKRFLDARTNWEREDIAALFDEPFADLVFTAQSVHRTHFNSNEVQLSQLLSIKTGGCPEDCGYCSQSAHFETGLKATKLMDVGEVVTAARAAQQGGAQRFCMGAAWRSPKDRDMIALCDMVREVKSLGLETCMTLGMLTKSQAQQLAEAGLDFYNHNIDTGPDYYKEIITTRTFGDRLETLENVREAGMKTCCGGIIGMGESRKDRIDMLHVLATLPEHPQSVPINALVRVDGTKLADTSGIDEVEFVRTIAVARLTMPKSVVRLSAGREQMGEAFQALCLIAGANSLFIGEKLLTTKNPERSEDEILLHKLGVQPMQMSA
jgi:biotin synthase